jgi:hypothetical protein
MSPFEHDGAPLSLRDLGSPADWLGDFLSLAGLVVIAVGLTFLLWAMIDTPDASQHASITITNH